MLVSVGSVKLESVMHSSVFVDESISISIGSALSQFTELAAERKSVSSCSLMNAYDVTIWSTSRAQFQASFDSAKRWSPNCGLPINDDNCAHMSFGASACTFNILGGQQFRKATQLEVSGFWISDNLFLSYHYQKASEPAFCVLKMLHRSCPIMGKEDFPFLFSTYIIPILKYDSQIAHNGLIGERDSLERVQMRGAKLIKGHSDLLYSARLAELNLYPLESRRIRGDLMLLFQLFQTGDVHDFFTLTAQNHLRGHDKRLILSYCRTRIRHNFFTLRVISTWNALPEEIGHSPSKMIFKRLLDSYIGLKT